MRLCRRPDTWLGERKDVLRRLLRRQAVAEPEHRFYLYCEGTKTEPAYFRAVSRRFRNAQLLIEAIGVGGVVLTVADQAIDHAKKRRSGRSRRGGGMSSFGKADQVWAVFDRNGHPHFNEAVAKCRDNHVLVAQSNPCFELWLVLHLEDYDRPANPRDLQAQLHRLFPEYDHAQSPNPNFDGFVEKMEAAEKRASSQLRRRGDEQQPFGNPSTTVVCLTHAIREAHNRARRPGGNQ